MRRGDDYAGESVRVCMRCFGALVDDPERCLHCGSVRPPLGWERETFLRRCLLGRYDVTRRLGAGATGAVYEARDRRAAAGEDGRVAMKFLHDELAGKEPLALRFRREALAAARIDHPAVARTIAYGELPEGAPYLVMEHVAGRSLHELLEDQRRIPVPAAIDLGLQIAEGLEAAHAAGVIHRDLKPANIYLTRGEDGRDRIKILDFGYAVIKAPDRRQIPRLTATGIVVGTPAYMAPEQTFSRRSGTEGWTVDGRVDLFSLGVLLYRALSGSLPLRAETVNDQLRMQRSDTPKSLAEVVPLAPVPRELNELVMQLLAKSPEDRPRTAREVRKALWPLSTAASAPAEEPKAAPTEAPKSHVPPSVLPDRKSAPVPAAPARPTGEFEDATLDDPEPAEVGSWRNSLPAMLVAIALAAALLVVILALLGVF